VQKEIIKKKIFTDRIHSHIADNKWGMHIWNVCGTKTKEIVSKVVLSSRTERSDLIFLTISKDCFVVNSAQ